MITYKHYGPHQRCVWAIVYTETEEGHCPPMHYCLSNLAREQRGMAWLQLEYHSVPVFNARLQQRARINTMIDYTYSCVPKINYI